MAMSPARRLLAGPLITAALVLLAGCGADGLPPTAAVTKDGGAAGAAYATGTGDAKDDAATASPFGDPTAKAPGGREIIQNPTLADVMATSPLPEMAWGRADAPVTIIQYASLTCPHCRNFHKVTFPDLKRTYIDTGKVRYILREFPIGKTSGNATIALRCAPADKYLDLYGRFMDQQTAWVSQEVRLDAIYAVAQQVGMTRAQFDSCLSNQAMIENFKWVKDRGRTLGIVGTPNYFVGNKLIKKELTMADIRELVEAPNGAAAAALVAKPRL